MTSLDLPERAGRALDTWLAHHDRLAPGLVEGCYLVGSLALDDWAPRSDIDVVALTAAPVTTDEFEQLRRAHDGAVSQVAGLAIDGPYLAWGDLTTPPLAVRRPWTLGGEIRDDGDCFEVNPVTWYTLATHGVAVRGVEPGELDVWLDEAERISWVRENVDTYWRSVLGDVVAALADDPSRDRFAAETTEWCALGVARMAFTAATGEVTSKTGAGTWAIEQFAPHAEVLSAALGHRHDPDPPPVGRREVLAVVDLMRDVVDAVTT